VVAVSLKNANRYVAWLSRHTKQKYRLLAEAEWEYAARSGSASARPWGEDIGTGHAQCTGCDAQAPAGTLPVDKTYANKWGLQGMLGNVWEWVADCQNPSYTGAPADGAVWQTGDCSRHVLRGGGWTTAPRGVRAAARSFFPADRRDINIGFRVATAVE
jgi:formylglycine-generating enzyme required for sulfatase activity